MSVVQFVGRQGRGASGAPKSSIIAALDIGSTKISCFIAEVQPPKTRGQVDPRSLIKVIGIGQTAARGVQAGTVVDVNAAECAVRVAVDAAERTAQTSISDVMVSVSGGKPTSSCFSGRVRTQTGVVSPRDIDFAISQALSNIEIGKRTILHLNPVNHVLDGVGNIAQPLGLHGEALQSDIGVTTVEPSYLRNMSVAIERAHLVPTGFVLAPYAAAKAALTPDELSLGAIVIDMGGAVTSIGFMRNGKLVAADSLAIGGQVVTNDVAQGLSTPLAHAERMKTLWGNVLPGGHGEREMLAVPLVGERGTDTIQKVPKSFLTSILQARLEEIFELIRQRLDAPIFAAAAGARVVLTGGASQLSGLRELAAAMLGRPVRLGNAASLNGLPEHMRHAGFAVATGALVYAAQPDQHYAVPQEAQAHLQRANMGYARRVGQWLAEAL
jgi:cell division protein FtsA